MSADVFTAERVSERVVKIVEADTSGQYPFLYVIEGRDRVVVIDTGTGARNFKAYVDAHYNPAGKPYVVVNTHVHFDHTGGNKDFAGQDDVAEIAMSSADQTFTNNSEITSLCLAHSRPSPVLGITRWLDDGDHVYLDAANPVLQNSLQVIHTPGHTSDSIALYLRPEGRLFIGDTVYPYTPIHLDCIGSSTQAFADTLAKLSAFVAARVEERKGMDPTAFKPPTTGPTGSTGPTPPPPTSDPVATTESGSNGGEGEEESVPKGPMADLEPHQRNAVESFLAVMGADFETLNAMICVVDFMELNGWAPGNAINLFSDNPEAAMSMAPPKPASISLPPTSQTSSASAPSSGAQLFAQSEDPASVVLSCGHVEANLPSSALDDMAAFLVAIQSGAMMPSHNDGSGYSEYFSGVYAVIIPDADVQ